MKDLSDGTPAGSIKIKTTEISWKCMLGIWLILQYVCFLLINMFIYVLLIPSLLMCTVLKETN